MEKMFEKLQKENAALKERVLSLEQKIEILNEEIKGRDNMFISISHDLKNKFQIIKGFSKELLDKFGKLSEEDRLKYTQRAFFASRDSEKIFLNLLDWAKAKSNKTLISIAKIDLNEMVNETVEDLNFLLSLKAINLKLNICDFFQINADKDMIEFVVRNLITNAIKFSPENSQINFSICTTSKKDELLFSLEDNGIGMSQEVLANLFKVGKEVRQNDTSNKKGSGIGLLICKEFVEKHGGRIWAESEARKGSKFYFTLPIN